MDALTRLRRYLAGDPVEIMSIAHAEAIITEIEGKDCRIQELIEANHRYLERAREAERQLKEAGDTIAEFSAANRHLGGMLSKSEALLRNLIKDQVPPKTWEDWQSWDLGCSVGDVREIERLLNGPRT